MIRPAVAADARGIAEVQVASWHAAYRGLMPDAKLDAFTVAVREPAWVRNLAQDSVDRRTTVCQRAGRIVGFTSVGPSRDEPGQGEVWALYAAPDAWGTGAGRELLQDGLAFLASSGWPRAMLWVLEGNVRAIRFYEAGGFRLDGGRADKEGLVHLRMSRDLSLR